MLNKTILDQIAILPMHDLSPLLTHPPFHQGVADAQKGFLYEYEAAPLDMDQMTTLVDEYLGRESTRLGHEMFDGTNLEVANSYFWYLGFVFGIINEGLSYKTPSADHSDLSPLLTHPDFLQGVSLAQDSFLDCYAPAPLTEDEMINEVEDNVGRANVEQSKAVMRAFGVGGSGRPYSYFWYLGLVFGTINEGLTYSHTIGS